MSIKDRIIQKKLDGCNVVIPYILAGDGGFEKTAYLLKLIEEKNPVAIEIGIPFSDPSSDGDTIQNAAKRSIETGTNINNTIDFLQKYDGDNSVPKIIMTYINPVLKFGVPKFFSELNKANVSAVIIPDLPVEEYVLIESECKEFNIEIISLIAPNTSDERIKYIESRSSGFLYLVTVTGTTGGRQSFSSDVYERIKRIKEYATLPVVAGFGISTKVQINKINKVCDGSIVGSQIVKLAYEEKYMEISDLLV